MKIYIRAEPNEVILKPRSSSNVKTMVTGIPDVTKFPFEWEKHTSAQLLPFDFLICFVVNFNLGLYGNLVDNPGTQ